MLKFPIKVNSTLLFPGGSDSKDSACNLGDSGSIPGLGVFPGEGIGLPTPVYLGLASGSDGEELTRNAGTQVWSLGREDPLE